MRSDSFASQVLGNIARTAPPFAEGQFCQAEDGRAPEAEPRSFFSWLRHALAYEPLHDDSPGRDAMRVRRDEEATQLRQTFTRVPAQHDHQSETDPVQPEDHGLREHQAQEPVDQPTTTAAPGLDAELQQRLGHAARQLWHQLAELEASGYALSTRDEETRDRVRLVLELIRTTELNSLDLSDPLYAEYLAELIALRETLETVLGRSQLVRSSQRRNPRSVPSDADLSDEQPPDQPPTHRSSSARSSKTQARLEGAVFLTVAEVASVMRVSKMTVHRLVHNGHLPAIRVGRSFRVPEDAVHALLREQAGVDPVSVGLLVALAGGAGGEVGRQALAGLSALVRRPFRRGDGTAGQDPPVSSGVAELVRLEQDPADQARAQALSTALAARAVLDTGFRTALEAWHEQAKLVRTGDGEVTNTISGGTLNEPVLQGRDFSGLSFTTTPPPPVRPPAADADADADGATPPAQG